MMVLMTHDLQGRVIMVILTSDLKRRVRKVLMTHELKRRVRTVILTHDLKRSVRMMHSPHDLQRRVRKVLMLLLLLTHWRSSIMVNPIYLCQYNTPCQCEICSVLCVVCQEQHTAFSVQCAFCNL